MRFPIFTFTTSYIISEDSEFYETALEVYYDVKEKYEK